METKVKRRRRTAEERIAELEQKRLEILAKQREALAKIDEQKARLADRKGARKEMLEQQKRFQQAVQKLVPEWDYRHFIALVVYAQAQGLDSDALVKRGEALLEEHGKSKRGRRSRAQ